MASLTAELFDKAHALGFDRVGVARVETLTVEGERLRAWLAAGYAGQMRYMARTTETRIDPRRGMLSSARSIVVLALAYARPDEPAAPAPGRIARYARGRDYHNVAGKRAKRLARWLRARGHKARPATDQMPVYERAWAERAGVGFVGKNCCLIVPGLGSHVVLSTVLTSADLEPGVPGEPRCGSCTACLQACPTDAFVDAFVLDARRCLSYLTIEQPDPITEALRPALGDRLFGCDDCQDVCPWTRVPFASLDATAPFATDPRWRTRDAVSLLELDEEGFLALTDATPLRRAGRDGLARNAAVLLGNAGDARHLPVLRQAAAHDPSPVVREAAAWAVERLTRPERGSGS